MTKIVGVSFGTKNGNNDTICKAVLLAAQNQGCEVEFIRAMDLDIKHCTGCITCVKMLMSGTKNMCVHKDDFDWLAFEMFHADGVVMVDGADIVGGEGPMAPTRCGALPVAEVLDYLDAGHATADVRRMCMKTGGFVDLLGTSDALEVSRRAEAGDEACRRAWDAMVYQICKEIGAMAAALGGNVDGILLGGGMVHNKGLVCAIEERCVWIAPVFAYPGEFELEAMAAGARRVLDGDEEPLRYTGKSVFDGFACFEG